ncbi:response regulator [uncultured Photobacterium sp.]|uniref:response regulator n=1 Tax=uncultured Photobacterium sp. TaxID=173973 RepID=UPI00261E90AE|nr:response regulator [uncultured Photobacterium sp.]
MDRFLIVEDNKLMAEILAQILRKCTNPREIIKVSNVSTAQRALIDASDRIDAIFLDLNIENPLDGIELLSYIKKNLPKMPVAIITSESETEVVKKVLSHQPQDYLIKPLSVHKVQRSLEKFRATIRREVDKAQ